MQLSWLCLQTFYRHVLNRLVGGKMFILHGLVTPLLTPKQPPISTKIHSHMSEGPTVLWPKFRCNRTMRWCNSGQMLITKWPILTPRRPLTSTKIHSHVSLGPVVLWPEFRRNRPLHWEDIEKVCTKCLTSSQTHTHTHTRHMMPIGLFLLRTLRERPKKYISSIFTQPNTLKSKFSNISARIHY